MLSSQPELGVFLVERVEMELMELLAVEIQTELWDLLVLELHLLDQTRLQKGRYVHHEECD